MIIVFNTACPPGLAEGSTAHCLLPSVMSFTRDNVPARRVAQAVGLGGIAVGIVAVVSIFQSRPINLLIAVASFVPLLIAVTAVGLVVSLVFRRWMLVTASAVLLAVVSAVVGPLYVADGHVADDEIPRGQTLRIMQANLLFGQADPGSVVATVRDNDVDALTVQELTHPLAQAMNDLGLDDLLPYQYLVPDDAGGAGAGIYSRYPLAEMRELNGFGPTNLVARVDLPTSFELVAVHPGPAYITPPDVWTAELDTLRVALEDLAATPSPVVVSGDFNTTYLHRQFRDLLDAGYSDAADQLGTGIIPTYPTDKGFPAVIGIDHVLTRGAHAQSLQRITVEGSDHHGLIVDVSFPS